MRVGTNMRSAFVAAIFRKSIVLSHQARSVRVFSVDLLFYFQRDDMSTGKILNLMTADTATVSCMLFYCVTLSRLKCFVVSFGCSLSCSYFKFLK